jgi:hypothetical protein
VHKKSKNKKKLQLPFEMTTGSSRRFKRQLGHADQLHPAADLEFQPKQRWISTAFDHSSFKQPWRYTFETTAAVHF